MKVIAWGTYDLSKPRTRILLAALERAGVDVEEVHTDVWAGVADKSQVRGLASKLGLGARWLTSYASLIARYLRTEPADAVFIGYLGQLDVLVLAPLALLRGEKIVWDAFISLYDTMVNDRAMARPNSAKARALFAWEWLACRAADVVLLDTSAHARYFADTYGVPERTASAYVGAEAAFAPRARRRAAADGGGGDDVVTALFYGQFIPLHGIATIVEAARLSDPKRVRFVLVGKGQEQAAIARMLEERPVPNLEWLPWIEYDALPEKIADADICLGIFGDSEKAARVIPNKVFQILAMGKPLITRDSPGIRELLSERDAGVYLVPPADAAAIVAAIERYRADRSKLVEPLHREVVERFSQEAIGAALKELFGAARGGTSRQRK